MIQRINFLRERTVGLSYKKMAQVTLGVFALVGLLALMQNLRLRYHQSRLEHIEARIVELKSSGKGASLSELGPIQAISAVLAKQVPWAEVLDAISRSVDDGIWLESLHGEVKEAEKDDKKDKEDSKEDEKEGVFLSIHGTAYQAGLVPSMLNRIRSFDIFSEVNLISTESTGNVDAPFKFLIKAQIKGQ